MYVIQSGIMMALTGNSGYPFSRLYFSAPPRAHPTVTVSSLLLYVNNFRRCLRYFANRVVKVFFHTAEDHDEC